jgi:hypothetical protein
LLAGSEAIIIKAKPICEAIYFNQKSAVECVPNMSSNVDAAITEALGLDPSRTRIVSHGGSGFASTFKLSSNVDGTEKNYFVKTGTGPEAELMFQGEAY